MIHILITLYWGAVIALSLYGLLGLYTFWQYWRYRQQEPATPPRPAADFWPAVTVQLPLYNEPLVVKRLITAAVALRYPPQLLQIQVIDDSNDGTTEQAARLVRYYQRHGVNISLLHRSNRAGFKAGALAAALPAASGEFLAIFDADFVPHDDFLELTIPHFIAEPQLGMVQTRWGHLNVDESALTAAQAIALDKHFAMEQTVRYRAALFPKFNGAGGLWRRSCLVDVGGWQAATVCEDLCLSTRALLKGWEFRFLNEVTAPAEIPASIAAYKSQQARWAKGSSQCLQKYSWPILKNREHSLAARLYALLTMSAYTTHILVLLLLLLQIPLMLLDYQVPSWILLFTLAGLGQPLLFILGQQVLYSDWLWRLRHFPTLFLLALGMGPTNSRAILQAFSGREHTFVRTPKQGGYQIQAGGHSSFDWVILAELLLAGYAIGGLALAWLQGNTGPVFFLLSCALGYLFVASLSLYEIWQQRIAYPRLRISPTTKNP